MKLYKHQSEALEATRLFNRVGYYHDMGLGKTYTGAEKMRELGLKLNLVVCQKSKINDWIEHFEEHYPEWNVFNLTTWEREDWNGLKNWPADNLTDVFVINYDLVFRRPELLKLNNFTLMLDESSLIQNEQAKRSKFILSLKPENVILLSGTPTGGKYERLWTQLHLLGWNISKDMFYNTYVNFYYDTSQGFPLMIINGYKNQRRLKKKMREHGCHFLKTKDVFDLPDQIHQEIKVDTSREYDEFKRHSITTVDGLELVGDTSLLQMLYERELCGQYSDDKIKAFEDILQSTNDRLIVFYNFNAELNKLLELVGDRPHGVVNGATKQSEILNRQSAVLFVQYQAGAMGLNLQVANKIIYFTPPLSSELFEQSKKRIHRINQTKTCFYYYLICKNSIEEKIYSILKMRKDYTDRLFREERESHEK